MRRMVLATTLAFLIPTALAAEVELRCSWEPTATGFGKPLDQTVAIAAQFFDPEHPLHLVLDLAKSSVAFPSEVDQLLLGTGSVSVEDKLRIMFDNPKMKGLSGVRSRLLITIDRYDLSSGLFLSTWEEKDGQYYARWVRRGECKGRVF